MQEERKNQQPQDDRPKYEPPQAMRLTAVRAGEGTCIGSGSNDINCCYWTGYSADGPCRDLGNTATGYCDSGSSPDA